MSKLTDLIPEVAPEYDALIKKTAAELSDSPFFSETLDSMNAIIKKAESKYSSEKEKVAFRRMDAGQLARGAGAALGVMTAGGIALALAGDIYEAAKRGLTKGRNFRRMLDANPELKDPSKAAKVQSSFSTLHRFNPEFSADPYVAGAYVRQSVEIPGGELATVKDLVQSRKALREGSGLPRIPGSPAVLDVG